MPINVSPSRTFSSVVNSASSTIPPAMNGSLSTNIMDSHGETDKAAPVSTKVSLLPPKLGHTGADTFALRSLAGTGDPCPSLKLPNPFPADLLRDIAQTRTRCDKQDFLTDKGKVVLETSDPAAAPPSKDLAAKPSILGDPRRIFSGPSGSSRPPASRPRLSAAEKGKSLLPAMDKNPPPKPKTFHPYVGFKLYFDHDGQDVVHIDDEEILSVEDVWGFSLIGYFVGNTPSLKDIDIMRDNWKIPNVFKKEKGWLTFRFNSASERDEVLEKGPYFADRRLLVLKPVPDFFNFAKDDLSSIPTWIKFSNLPAQFWSPSILAKLGSRVGKPLYVDPFTESKEKKGFARLLVEVDCKSAQISSVTMAKKDGTVRDVLIEYENLPFHCTRCKIFGHDLKHCKKAKLRGRNSFSQWGHQVAAPTDGHRSKDPSRPHTNDQSVPKLYQAFSNPRPRNQVWKPKGKFPDSYPSLLDQHGAILCPAPSKPLPPSHSLTGTSTPPLPGTNGSTPPLVAADVGPQLTPILPVAPNPPSNIFPPPIPACLTPSLDPLPPIVALVNAPTKTKTKQTSVFVPEHLTNGYDIDIHGLSSSCSSLPSQPSEDTASVGSCCKNDPPVKVDFRGKFQDLRRSKRNRKVASSPPKSNLETRIAETVNNFVQEQLEGMTENLLHHSSPKKSPVRRSGSRKKARTVVFGLTQWPPGMPKKVGQSRGENGQFKRRAKDRDLPYPQ